MMVMARKLTPSPTTKWQEVFDIMADTVNYENEKLLPFVSQW